MPVGLKFVTSAPLAYGIYQLKVDLLSRNFHQNVILFGCLEWFYYLVYIV